MLAVLTESEQVVQPGTPLMDLGDPTKMQIAVDVLSSDAVKIEVDAPAAIKNWGGPTLRARVRSVNPTAQTKISALGIDEQRTEVVLDLLDPPQEWQRLGHGFRVVADIVIWEGKDRILVPISALFRIGEDWAVFRVQDGRATATPVTLGQRNASVGEVVSGLEPGETVITHPPDTIADGVAVSLPPADG